jgi:SAM-dependent methyltransferase
MSRLTHWLRSGRPPRRAAAPAPPATPTGHIGRHRLAPPLVCDLDVTPAERQALFEHVAANWKMLGETEPYWSVLTEPKYRTDAFAGHQEEFYDPRRAGGAAVAATFARNGEDFSPLQACLELGCGVGRSTATLARLLPQVIAVDVSPNHLAVARERLGGAGIGNVSWHQIGAVDDIEALPRFDLFFSEIVLQHNPPPIIAAMLERLFAKLDPGGYCLFQVPTYQDGYRFNVKEYLAVRRPPDRTRVESHIEMHILPQRVVHRLMREAGIALVEVVEDRLAGDPSYQSLTFFGRKARA